MRRGENPELTTREKHTRECFVVAKEGADKAAIEEAIVTMPNYFSDYDTTVHFISQEELDRDHSGIPHGGMVFRTGVTGLNGENKHIIEYKLTLAGNPPRRIEGDGSSGWILLDFASVIVHVFGQNAREFYNIEKLFRAEDEVDLSEITAEE